MEDDKEKKDKLFLFTDELSEKMPKSQSVLLDLLEETRGEAEKEKLILEETLRKKEEEERRKKEEAEKKQKQEYKDKLEEERKKRDAIFIQHERKRKEIEIEEKIQRGEITRAELEGRVVLKQQKMKTFAFLFGGFIILCMIILFGGIFLFFSKQPPVDIIPKPTPPATKEETGLMAEKLPLFENMEAISTTPPSILIVKIPPSPPVYPEEKYIFIKEKAKITPQKPIIKIQTGIFGTKKVIK